MLNKIITYPFYLYYKWIINDDITIYVPFAIISKINLEDSKLKSNIIFNFRLQSDNFRNVRISLNIASLYARHTSNISVFISFVKILFDSFKNNKEELIYDLWTFTSQTGSSDLSRIKEIIHFLQGYQNSVERITKTSERMNLPISIKNFAEFEKKLNIESQWYNDLYYMGDNNEFYRVKKLNKLYNNKNDNISADETEKNCGNIDENNFSINNPIKKPKMIEDEYIMLNEYTLTLCREYLNFQGKDDIINYINNHKISIVIKDKKETFIYNQLRSKNEYDNNSNTYNVNNKINNSETLSSYQIHKKNNTMNEYKNVLNEIDSIKNKIRKDDDLFEKLVRMVTDLQNTTNHLEEECTNRRIQIDEYKNKIYELYFELKNLRNDISELEIKHIKNNELLDIISNENKYLKNHIASMEKKINNIINQNKPNNIHTYRDIDNLFGMKYKANKNIDDINNSSKNNKNIYPYGYINNNYNNRFYNNENDDEKKNNSIDNSISNIINELKTEINSQMSKFSNSISVLQYKIDKLQNKNDINDYKSENNNHYNKINTERNIFDNNILTEYISKVQSNTSTSKSNIDFEKHEENDDLVNKKTKKIHTIDVAINEHSNKKQKTIKNDIFNTNIQKTNDQKQWGNIDKDALLLCEIAKINNR